MQAASTRTGRSRRYSTGSTGRRKGYAPTTASQMSIGGFVQRGAKEKQQMQDLNTRLGAFISNTKDKSALADKLQSELERQRRDYEDRLRRAEEEAERARADCEAEKDRMRRELEQAKDDARRYKQDLEDANDRLSRAKEDLAAARSELDSAKASSREGEARLREEFQKKLEDWIKDKRAQDQKDKEEWMKIFNEQNKNIKSYKDANAELREKNSGLNSKLDACNGRARDLEDQIAEKNDLIDELKRSQVSMRAEIDQFKRLLDEEVGDAETVGAGGRRKKSFATSQGTSAGSKRTNYLFEKGSNSKYKLQTFYDQDKQKKTAAASTARSPKSQPRSPESRVTSKAASSRRRAASASAGSQRTNYLFEKRSNGRYDMEAFYGRSPRSKASKSRASSGKQYSRGYSGAGGGAGGGGSFGAAPSGYQSNGSRRTKSYVSSRRSSQKTRSNHAPASRF